MSNDYENQPILLVEDEDTDAALMCRALTKAGVSNHVDIVRSGNEAISYLLRRAARTAEDDRALPCLILLDLKLPLCGGFEVLARVKFFPNLRRIPIVVLTSSSQTEDRDRAYKEGASSYQVKPCETRLYEILAMQIRHHWLECDTHTGSV